MFDFSVFNRLNKVFQFSDDNAIYLSNIYIDKRSNFSAFSTRNILARLQIH